MAEHKDKTTMSTTISRAMKIERESAAKESASYNFERDLESSDFKPGDIVYFMKYSQSNPDCTNGSYAVRRKMKADPVKVLNIVGASITFVSKTGRTMVRERSHFADNKEDADKKSFVEDLDHEAGFVLYITCGGRSGKTTVEKIKAARSDYIRRKHKVLPLREDRLAKAVSNHNYNVNHA
jgi:hypothetical protein